MTLSKMYTRGNIYLSGGMQFAQNQGANWRKDCAKKLKDLEYFPIDIVELDKEYANKFGSVFYNYNDVITEEENIEFKSNFRKHYHEADCNLVKNDSDALIVLWDEAAQLGAGTHSEIHAAFENDIPVFLVTDFPRSKISGWLVSETTKIFTNFTDLYEYLEKLPFGILCRDIYGNHSSGKNYLCFLCGESFIKNKHQFVSKVTPLYCNGCVDVVTETNDAVNRYNFFRNYYLKEEE